MPFYSIVMPVFNRGHLVAATLESVLAQTESDWEIIVVDDGSTDETMAILKRYRARCGDKMRVIQQGNKGPGAARNVAVAAARGRYIAFLDSDDLWFPWTLEFYRQQLEKHDYPRVFGRRAAHLSRRRAMATGARKDPESSGEKRTGQNL